jgi:uncharacterized protein YdeI (BOF family)
MERPQLLKLSLAISLLGTLLLLFLSNLEPKLTTISQLNQTELEKRVKIQGRIINAKQIKSNFYILTVEDSSGRIEVLLNKNLSNNRTLEIIGNLNKYKGKLQIKADIIREK